MKSSAIARLAAWRSGFALRATHAFRCRQILNRVQNLKCYLTKLRHEGKRLQSDQLAQPARLVTLTLSANRGSRQLKAVCCLGGSTVGYLWEPTLSHLGDDDLTLHGYERMGDAGVVQEWRLKPHCVPATPSQGREE